MKLKPCPFCGGEAEIHKEQAWRTAWLVECHNLGCVVHPETPWYPTEKAAIAAWNKRAKE